MRRFRGFNAEWGWEEIVPSSGTEPSMNRGSALFTKDGTDFLVLGGLYENSGGSDIERADYWRYSTSSGTWTKVLAGVVDLGGDPLDGLDDTIVSSAAYGFADGSGNVYRGNAGTAYEIAKSTGAETLLSWSGSTNVGLAACADISAKKLLAANPGAGNAPGSGASANVISLALSSSAATATSFSVSSQTGRRIRSSAGYCPDNDTLYLFAPSVASSSTTWTLGTSDIVKYDLTGSTGWTVETGITNNAGSVSLGIEEENALVWVDSESKFFLFAGGAGSYSVGTVISYDPATKELAQLIFDGSNTTFLNQCRNGNAGDVVVDGSDVYFLRKRASYADRNNPARIWKFRRN